MRRAVMLGLAAVPALAGCDEYELIDIEVDVTGTAVEAASEDDPIGIFVSFDAQQPGALLWTVCEPAPVVVTHREHRRGCALPTEVGVWAQALEGVARTEVGCGDTFQYGVARPPPGLPTMTAFASNTVCHGGSDQVSFRLETVSADP